MSTLLEEIATMFDVDLNDDYEPSEDVQDDITPDTHKDATSKENEGVRLKLG